jgi:hypothetical protein
VYLWLIFGEKGEYLATAPNRACDNARKIFAKPLHPEFVQHNLRYLGSKFSTCGRKQLHIGAANSCRVRRIGEIENSAPSSKR